MGLFVGVVAQVSGAAGDASDVVFSAMSNLVESHSIAVHIASVDRVAQRPIFVVETEAPFEVRALVVELEAARRDLL